jgi:hypothetical protein
MVYVRNRSEGARFRCRGRAALPPKFGAVHQSLFRLNLGEACLPAWQSAAAAARRSWTQACVEGSGTGRHMLAGDFVKDSQHTTAFILRSTVECVHLRQAGGAALWDDGWCQGVRIAQDQFEQQAPQRSKDPFL